MESSQPSNSRSASVALLEGDGPETAEAAAWAGIGPGWQRLHGDVRDTGYSLEWHEFTTAERELDWARSFQPDSLEICVNLQGNGTVRAADAQLDLQPRTAGFYVQRREAPPLLGARAAAERHQFLTLGFSFGFLRHYLPADDAALHPGVKNLLAGRPDAGVSEPLGLTHDQRRLAASLRQPPPVGPAGRPLWYRAKALEVAATLFYPAAAASAAAEDEFFCQRQKRLNHERVQKVVAMLRANLTEPLTLEEIGRRVGCSHFYLSRIFTQEVGKPIFQFLRELRLERAAELLRAGRLNVTQVAMAVGYASPSHFSTAFHAMFGCCPGLYPLATTTQRPGRKSGAPTKQA